MRFEKRKRLSKPATQTELPKFVKKVHVWRKNNFLGVRETSGHSANCLGQVVNAKEGKFICSYCGNEVEIL